MKILLLTTHLNYGGISSYCVSLARRLAENGHTVTIASASGDLVGQLERSNISHIHIPIKTKSELSPLVVISMLKLLRFVRQESIDIIHAQTRVTQVLAWYLSKITKIPFLTTCHGFFRRNIGRQFLPCWGRQVIAISEAVRRHLMIDFYVSDENIALIHNGIDIGQFKVSPKRKDINHPDRTVGIIARLSLVKGHTYLIEAMAEVLSEFPDARLFIFGEGKIKYKLVQQAKELKINEKVFFMPAVANTAEVLQEIDIFVMPSLNEGLGLSVLEAQACSLAVIASNVGGIPTLVKDELTGLLVSAKQPRALAAAIMKIMQNKEVAMRLGQSARREVEKKFDLEQMAQKVEKVYKQVLKR